jgi:hypothetical protein
MVEQLQEKLRKIEALHRGATTSGERDAAASAYARVNKRIFEMNDLKLELDDPTIELNNSMAELRCSFPDEWCLLLFTALCMRRELLSKNGREAVARNCPWASCPAVTTGASGWCGGHFKPRRVFRSRYGRAIRG